MVIQKSVKKYIHVALFLTGCSAIVLMSSCTKNTINDDTSGEVYKKYAGDYLASGTEIRYRVGIDTATYIDSFRMSITKFSDPSQDSTLLESQVFIVNFLGSGATVKANASYTDIVPFASLVLPNYKSIQMHSETKSILNYSYYRINGVGDTSRFSGKANKQ